MPTGAHIYRIPYLGPGTVPGLSTTHPVQTPGMRIPWKYRNKRFGFNNQNASFRGGENGCCNHPQDGLPCQGQKGNLTHAITSINLGIPAAFSGHLWV